MIFHQTYKKTLENTNIDEHRIVERNEEHFMPQAEKAMKKLDRREKGKKQKTMMYK